MMRINEEKREEISKRAESGEDSQELAREYGICRKTVERIRKNKEQGEGGMTLEWKERFAAAWANIYPGDAERERRRRAEDEMRTEVSGS